MPQWIKDFDWLLTAGVAFVSSWILKGKQPHSKTANESAEAISTQLETINKAMTQIDKQAGQIANLNKEADECRLDRKRLKEENARQGELIIKLMVKIEKLESTIEKLIE